MSLESVNKCLTIKLLFVVSGTFYSSVTEHILLLLTLTKITIIFPEMIIKIAGGEINSSPYNNLYQRRISTNIMS